jgi:hypothetical protein
MFISVHFLHFLSLKNIANPYHWHVDPLLSFAETSVLQVFTRLVLHGIDL